jgi:PAS domain S-box-containing protein
MLDTKKTKAQLIEELTALKSRLRRLEAARSAKTDQRLQEWIQRYELVVAATGQIAYEYDVATGRILWGATIEKVLGYSMGEISGGYSQWMDLLHPDDKAAALAHLEQAKAACSYWDEQYRMRHKDGHYVCIRDRGFFVADRAGRATRQLGMLEDVTERKEAEESLARSREQTSFLADLLERSSQPFGIGYPDGRMGLCNTAFLNLVGYSREEFANVDWLRDLTPPEWRDAGRVRLEELQRTGLPVRYEKEYIRKDGSRVPIELLVHLARDEQGNPKHYYAFLTDISDRKRAEAALRTSESFLRSVIEQNPCPVWISDDKGTLLKLNQALRDLLRISDEEVVGKYNIFQDNIVEEAGLMPQVRRVFEEGGVARFELEYDSSRLKGLSLERNVSATLDVTVFPIRNAAGRITNAVIQHVDITDRKQMERSREETIELLGLCNPGGDLRHLLRDLTAYFHRVADCEAVGIRLREGHDFPYCETRGFPPEFVLAENRLCAVDEAGELIRDSVGNPVIECMCGNILCGRFDPSRPFFTAHGSFWSNCTTDLLASTTEADRQARSRNRCNGEGYESVALLPLRSGGRTFGLLQLNDKRRGRFSPESIARYERLADYVAIAILQRLAVDELSLNERKLSNAVRIARLGYWEYDVARNLFTFDDHFYEIFRTSAEKVGGYTMTPDRYAELFLHPDDAEVVSREMELALTTTDPNLDRYLEHRIKYADGETGYIGVRFFVVKDERGRTIKTYGANQDITERKKVEIALRESERQLESVARFPMENPHPVARVGQDGVVLFANAAAALLLEAAGSGVGLSAPADWCSRKSWDVTEANPGMVEIKSAGSVYSLHLVAVPGRNYVNIYGRDITERKRAEEALRESEERFRQVVENINEVLWLTDWVKRELLYVSPSYETVYGRSCESLYKDRRSWIEAIHPEDRARISSSFAEKGRRGEYTEEEYRIIQPDGAIRWVRDRSFPVYNASGEVTRWVGVAEDFTERKLAEGALQRAHDELEQRVRDRTSELTAANQRLQEEIRHREATEVALRDSRDLLRAVMDGITDVIFTKNQEGRYCLVNAAITAWTGKTPREVIGRDCTDIFPPEEARRRREEDLTVMQTKTPIHCEMTVFMQGQPRSFLLSKMPHLDSRGEVVGVIGIARDITEFKQTQELLRRAERLASVGTLAAGIAHEINNPVGAIYLATQNALSCLEENGDRQEVIRCLRDVLEDAARCGQIVSNLLRFAKEEPLEKAPVDLVVVLEKAVDILRPLAEERGVALETALSPAPLRVLANRTALLQAMENVIRNGIQASDTGYPVNIGTERVGREVRVVVTDLGAGLTTEQQEHMFDPFYTSRRTEGGTGLGLSIVHGVIADHAGTIRVESTRGRGTKVTLVLPTCP